MTFIFENNDEIVPSKSNKPKLVRGMDPWIWIRTKISWIRNTVIETSYRTCISHWNEYGPKTGSRYKFH
jgi:hypothetical protein